MAAAATGASAAPPAALVSAVATVPRFTVDLDAPAAVRWAHIAAVYQEQLRGVEAVVDATIREIAPTLGPLAAGFVSLLTSASVSTGKVFYSAELEGMAEAAKMPIGRLAAMQFVYEAAAHCTSIVVPRSTTPAHIRTMDWSMDFLRPLTIEVEFVRAGATVAVITTWAGYVGALTGLAVRPTSSCNFSLSVNFRVVGTGTFWTNLKAAVGDSWPIGFLAREVLVDAADYNVATTQLRASKLIAPCYFTVAGATGSSADGCIITRDRELDEQFLDLASAPRGSLVQPNMDHWSSRPDESIMVSIERRHLGYQLIEAARRRDGLAAFDDRERLWELISESPICGPITVYGTLMIPSEGWLQTRLPQGRYAFRDVPRRRVDDKKPAFPTCTRCAAVFDDAINPPGRCSHVGTWHATYDDCSYLKCGYGLGPSGIGKQHWSCCFSTQRGSVCPKSEPHSS